MDAKTVFNEELATFEGEDSSKDNLTGFVCRVMESAPEYFLEDEDIIAKTKLSVKAANRLMQTSRVSQSFDADTRNLIRSALLLHDIFLYGDGRKGKAPYKRHPFQAAAWLTDNGKWEKDLPAFLRFQIADLVETHSGEWNMTEGDIPLKTPETDAQWFVHYCCHLADGLYVKQESGNVSDRKNMEDACFAIAKEMTQGKEWDGKLYKDSKGVFAVIDRNRVPVTKSLEGAFQSLGQARIHMQNAPGVDTLQEFYKKYPRWDRMVYGNPNERLYIIHDEKQVTISKAQAEALGIRFE